MSSPIDLNKPLLPEEIKKLTKEQKQALINKAQASSFYLKTLTGQAHLAQRRPPPANIKELVKEVDDQKKSSFLSNELKRLYNLL